MLFVDTFTHYYTPEVAEAALKVLRPAATRWRCCAGSMTPSRRGPCAVAAPISQGMVDEAKVEANG
jgi:Fe-S oxidoreductase